MVTDKWILTFMWRAERPRTANAILVEKQVENRHYFMSRLTVELQSSRRCGVSKGADESSIEQSPDTDPIAIVA